MITVYVVRIEANGDIYVGIAKEVELGLQEHTAGMNRYAKGLRPLVIIFRNNSRIGNPPENK